MATWHQQTLSNYCTHISDLRGISRFYGLDLIFFPHFYRRTWFCIPNCIYVFPQTSEAFRQVAKWHINAFSRVVFPLVRTKTITVQVDVQGQHWNTWRFVSRWRYNEPVFPSIYITCGWSLGNNLRWSCVVLTVRQSWLVLDSNSKSLS